GEGLVGFSWAFLRAGARRVIAGLWDADDRATGELMDRVYAGLAAGDRPARALRQAKLAMLHRGGASAAPYNWAPFELVTVTVPYPAAASRSAPDRPCTAAPPAEPSPSRRAPGSSRGSRSASGRRRDRIR